MAEVRQTHCIWQESLWEDIRWSAEEIAAIVLNANQTVMTAIANDYEYENIFSKQVAALGKEGDVLIGISTSGNSANVINALQEAKNKIYTRLD